MQRRRNAVPGLIEDYGFIGDLHTGALVGRDGSIDWLCLPRFDSGACFAALLGSVEHGRWSIAPIGGLRRTTRRYRDNTLILETTFHTDSGVATVTDFMPLRPSEQQSVTLGRIVSGVSGRVTFSMDLVLRFDYGLTVPWVVHNSRGLSATAGPNAVVVTSPVPLRGKDFHSTATFAVAEGETLPFGLTWYPSHQPAPPRIDMARALQDTHDWWEDWASKSIAPAPYAGAVRRSLVTLKGLTYRPTGGIVAAATTSLPELAGGVRNWDYRYCWLRDATFALYSLVVSGFTEEAEDWREWLLRAVAGKPSDLQIMYGLDGERLLPEFALDWLPGYEASTPVRVGNAAHRQFQLDVYGEVADVLYVSRQAGVEWDDQTWQIQRALVDFLEANWNNPDDGIWEVRSGGGQYTHSKVMAWVAVDRVLRAAERWQLDVPLDRWRALRSQIHASVCEMGFDVKQNTFVQAYGSTRLDASLLRLPLVGFLPATDPRMIGTVQAIQRDLIVNGLVSRYRSDGGADGLPPGEGAFLPCSFWLVDNLELMGQHQEATKLLERLLHIPNDLGLLAEEYDPVAGRQLGNFPQALSHVGLVNAIHNVSTGNGPAHQRSQGDKSTTGA